jgi:hypothetical protein
MAMNEDPYASLIPGVGDWAGDAANWLAMFGSYELCIAFTNLLWPEFVVHNECIFRGPFDEVAERNYNTFRNATDFDPFTTEVTMNALLILDLFPNDRNGASREQILFIGRKLKAMWQAKLLLDFPHRRTLVSFPEDWADDLREYEITFWQEPPAQASISSETHA